MAFKTLVSQVFYELDSKHLEVYSKMFISDGKIFILEKREANLHIIDIRTKGVAKIFLKHYGMGHRFLEQVRLLLGFLIVGQF